MERESHIRLFGDSRTTTFAVTVLEEAYEAAESLARENKWDQDYANAIIFANGVSYLQGKLVLEGVSTGNLKADETIQKQASDLQKYMSMYSAMKYHAYLKTVDNETMDTAMNALRNTISGLENRIDLFRKDEEKLKAELARLRAENQTLRRKVEEMQAQGQILESGPLEKPGPRAGVGLWRWLRRFGSVGKKRGA